MRRVSTACPTMVDSVNPVTNSDTNPTTSLAAKAADKAEREAGESPSTPPVFTAAVESMHAAQLRPHDHIQNTVAALSNTGLHHTPHRQRQGIRLGPGTKIILRAKHMN